MTNEREVAKIWAQAEGLSELLQISIATRCALRAVPLSLGDVFDENRALNVFRVGISLHAYSNEQSPEIEAAIWSLNKALLRENVASDFPFFALVFTTGVANERLREIPNLVDSAVLNLSVAMNDSSEAEGELPLKELEADILNLESLNSGRRLWATIGAGEHPSSIETALNDFEIRVADAEEIWGFWRRWYDSILDGSPFNRSLQSDVALIPDEEWEKGPERIADLIRAIEAHHRTNVSPRLVRNEKMNEFQIEEDALPPSETSEYVCGTVEISLKTALEASGANGFDERSSEAIQIRGTLDAPNKSVSVLAVGFYQACLSFDANIGDIYPDDAALKNLKNVLWTATEELCDLDPIAKARCARLAALQPKRDIDPPDREMIAKVPEIVGDELSDAARDIVESDVERILSEERPPKFVRARFTNWMSTISNWMDKGMKADKKASWLADLVSRLRDWWAS